MATDDDPVRARSSTTHTSACRPGTSAARSARCSPSPTQGRSYCRGSTPGAAPGENALALAARGPRRGGPRRLAEGDRQGDGAGRGSAISTAWTSSSPTRSGSAGWAVRSARPSTADCSTCSTITSVRCTSRPFGEVLEPGGVLHLLCFSDGEPPGWGPRRVSEEELRSTFAARLADPRDRERGLRDEPGAWRRARLARCRSPACRHSVASRAPMRRGGADTPEADLRVDPGDVVVVGREEHEFGASLERVGDEHPVTAPRGPAGGTPATSRRRRSRSRRRVAGASPPLRPRPTGGTRPPR